MNRDDVIRMAREAGFEIDCCSLEWHDRIERFAALVAAAAVRETSAEYRMGWNDGQINEREACAKVVEASPSYDWHRFAGEAAAAIRARGQA